MSTRYRLFLHNAIPILNILLDYMLFFMVSLGLVVFYLTQLWFFGKMKGIYNLIETHTIGYFRRSITIFVKSILLKLQSEKQSGESVKSHSSHLKNNGGYLEPTPQWRYHPQTPFFCFMLFRPVTSKLVLPFDNSASPQIDTSEKLFFWSHRFLVFILCDKWHCVEKCVSRIKFFFEISLIMSLCINLTCRFCSEVFFFARFSLSSEISSP